jgi:hypothetical protein
MNFLISALFLLASLCGSSSLAQPTQDESAFAETVPIADVHMHVYGRGGSRPNVLIPLMSNNNVRWGGGVGNYLVEMVEKLGPRYIGAAGQQEYFEIFRDYGPNGLMDPDNPLLLKLLTKVSTDFEIGSVKGFGELHTDNQHDLASKMARAIRTDNPAMRKFFAVAAKYSGFVQIHVESTPQALDDVLRLASDFPDVKIVLSHCMPHSTPEQLKALFQSRPNIYCELSANGPVHDVNGRGGRMFTKDGIQPSWKPFIFEFSNRIFLGTDPCCGRESQYNEMISEYRHYFLPALPIAMQEKIAFKNAVRVLGLRE